LWPRPRFGDLESVTHLDALAVAMAMPTRSRRAWGCLGGTVAGGAKVEDEADVGTLRRLYVDEELSLAVMATRSQASAAADRQAIARVHGRRTSSTAGGRPPIGHHRNRAATGDLTADGTWSLM
jgi:hypothetical protein